MCAKQVESASVYTIYTLAGRSHKRKNDGVMKCGQVGGIIDRVRPRRMDEKEDHRGSFHFEMEEDYFFFVHLLLFLFLFFFFLVCSFKCQSCLFISEHNCYLDPWVILSYNPV